MRQMSAVFFRDLRLPAPDYRLEVGSGSHAEQTAAVLERLEPVLLAERPDLVVVVGDVNSTLAAALCAAKLGIPIAHVEAGLRSGDRSMPEELNRIATDLLSTLLFTTERDAADNLRREGIAAERLHFVGNTMIDSLERMRAGGDSAAALAAAGVEPRRLRARHAAPSRKRRRSRSPRGARRRAGRDRRAAAARLAPPRAHPSAPPRARPPAPVDPTMRTSGASTPWRTRASWR